MVYLKLTINIPDPYQENLIAELLDLDFEGFEQFDNRLEAYIPKSRFNDVSREYIEQVLTVYPAEGYIETEEIEEKNWNEAWEKTIQSQSVGHFLVKPTWSSDQPSAGQILLEIDPKLSFGTGYHATTRLMLQELSSMDVAGKAVLDAGTGTGILAIAVAKMGAKQVFAFDIDEWCKTNALENALINRVENKIKIELGGFEVIPHESKYDLIVANINREVIIGMMGLLAGLLESDGILMVTGILGTDVDAVREKAVRHNLKVTRQKDQEEWSLLKLVRS